MVSLSVIRNNTLPSKLYEGLYQHLKSIKQKFVYTKILEIFVSLMSNSYSCFVFQNNEYYMKHSMKRYITSIIFYSWTGKKYNAAHKKKNMLLSTILKRIKIKVFFCPSPLLKKSTTRFPPKIFHYILTKLLREINLLVSAWLPTLMYLSLPGSAVW